MKRNYLRALYFEYAQSFGERARVTREQGRITREDMATSAKVSVDTIAAVEDGLTSPSPTLLRMYASLLPGGMQNLLADLGPPSDGSQVMEAYRRFTLLGSTPAVAVTMGVARQRVQALLKIGEAEGRFTLEDPQRRANLDARLSADIDLAMRLRLDRQLGIRRPSVKKTPEAARESALKDYLACAKQLGRNPSNGWLLRNAPGLRGRIERAYGGMKAFCEITGIRPERDPYGALRGRPRDPEQRRADLLARYRGHEQRLGFPPTSGWLQRNDGALFSGICLAFGGFGVFCQQHNISPQRESRKVAA